MRACLAADTCVRICTAFDRNLGIPKLSARHTKKSSNKDLELLIKALKEIRPFDYVKGRSFKDFEKISKNPRIKPNRQELLQAIQDKTYRLYLDA